MSPIYFGFFCPSSAFALLLQLCSGAWGGCGMETWARCWLGRRELLKLDSGRDRSLSLGLSQPIRSRWQYQPGKCYRCF